MESGKKSVSNCNGIENSQKLSIKDFIVFSFFIYPIGAFLMVSRDQLIEFFRSGLLFAVVSYVLFSFINYIWGQYRVRPFLSVLSCGVGLFFAIKILTDNFVNFTPNVTLTVLGAVIGYLTMFSVFLLAQFLTWIHFLARFLWQNRGNLDNLPFN